ncbi:hypothetical protein [Streptomyces sp. NPDC002104]
MRRAVTWVAVLLGVLVVTGCGEAGAPRAVTAPRLRPRMEEVARAWEGSAELKEWREGFHLLQEPVTLPSDAFHDGNDKTAYTEQNFALRGELPARGAAPALIRWADGATLEATALSASDAYRELTGGAPTRERPLTVTGARFGDLSVKTSRGPALVPAWFFDLEGYGEPLVRVALADARPAEPPIGPLDPAAGATSVMDHGPADRTSTEFTVGAGHGACDGGVAVDVLEGTDTVVLGGRILPGKEVAEGGGCPAVLLRATVPVALTRPLGDRVLVDAVSGAAIGLSRSRAS